jgi:hypothetical protein
MSCDACYKKEKPWPIMMSTLLPTGPALVDMSLNEETLLGTVEPVRPIPPVSFVMSAFEIRNMMVMKYTFIERHQEGVVIVEMRKRGGWRDVAMRIDRTRMEL